MNDLLNAIGDGMFAPFGADSGVLAVLVLAFMLAALSLLVFKVTSDQEAIRASKGPMKAHLLGVLLFRHDLRVVFRSLLRSLVASFAPIRYLLFPLTLMLVPLFFLFVQMDLHLGAKGLEPGRATVLRVHLLEGASLDDVRLVVPDGVRGERPGVRVETPGVRVRDPELGLYEVDFRIRAEREGVYDLWLTSSGTAVTKRLVVGPGLLRTPPVRPAAGLSAWLLHPGEDPVPEGSPIREIEVAYEAATLAFLSVDWAWWVLFLVAMVVFLFLLRGPLGVEF